jgi:phosphoglycolate phosphatase-like HAD superfamily hydrolase
VTAGPTVLFDVDNTLLYTGGAGGHAMNRAFAELYGVENGFGRVEFSGRTDLFILQGGLEGSGIGGDPREHLDAFLAAYVQLLPQSLKEREGHVMPGFPELLEELRAGGARLGLATGNFREGARLKLQYYGLTEYFAGGGFGEISLDRAEVVAQAIAAVGGENPPEKVLVVGDTPHDITAARENGAIAVGVATGTYSVEELEASGSQLTFADFSDWRSAAARLLAG